MAAWWCIHSSNEFHRRRREQERLDAVLTQSRPATVAEKPQPVKQEPPCLAWSEKDGFAKEGRFAGL